MGAVSRASMPSCARLGRARAPVPTRPGLALLRLQFALIFFNENLKIGNSIKQLYPLFVIERDRKAAQSVYADAAFLTYAELHSAASLLCLDLLFQIGQASFQFFISWFCHECTSNVFCLYYLSIIGAAANLRRGELEGWVAGRGRPALHLFRQKKRPTLKKNLR